MGNNATIRRVPTPAVPGAKPGSSQYASYESGCSDWDFYPSPDQAGYYKSCMRLCWEEPGCDRYAILQKKCAMLADGLGDADDCCKGSNPYHQSEVSLLEVMQLHECVVLS